MGEIAYQNKDITSKIFAESLKEKNFAVYGIDIPKITNIYPTNLPQIKANELRIDNLFQLEDGSFALIDYESTYRKIAKIKYSDYVNRIYQKYHKSFPI